MKNETCKQCDEFLLKDEISAGYSRINVYHSFMLALFGVVGMLGNFLVLYITLTNKSKQKKNPDLVAIILLAFIDLYACVFLIPYEIFQLQTYFSQTSAALCKSVGYLRAFTMCLTCCILFLIAVERCKVVCSLHGQSSKFAKRMRWALVFAVVVSLVLSSPVIMYMGIETRPVKEEDLEKFGVPVTNKIHRLVGISSTTTCEYLDKFNGTTLLQLHGFFMIVLFLVLIIITVICYGRIYVVVTRKIPMSNKIYPKPQYPVPGDGIPRSLEDNNSRESPRSLSVINNLQDSGEDVKRRNFRWRRQTPKVSIIYSRNFYKEAGTTSSRRQEEKGNRQPSLKFDNPSKRRQILISKMLFLVTGFFISSWTPFWVITFCYMYIHDLDFILTGVQISVVQTFFHLFYLNNAINPILYATYSLQFRLQCKSLFVSLWQRIKRKSSF